MRENCPANLLFQHLSKQWTLNILYTMERGEKSFSGLKRKLEGISSKTLSLRLKELEQNGYIIRQVEDQPRRICYSFTLKGASLSKKVIELQLWALDHDSQTDISLSSRAQD